MISLDYFYTTRPLASANMSKSRQIDVQVQCATDSFHLFARLRS